MQEMQHSQYSDWASACAVQHARYNDQLWHQHAQYSAAQFSDVPNRNGKLSDALKHELASKDLLDLKVLLRRRNIRTLRALRTLEKTERSVMLHKARLLYFEVLGGPCPEGVKTALSELFGELPQQDMSHPRATQSRGHGVWGPMPIVPEFSEHVDVPLEDDTKLKREFNTAVPLARGIVGPRNYAQFIQKVRRSDELIMAGCVVAAEALAILCIRKEDVLPRQWENLKAAKRSVRNLIIWRCAGLSIGLDRVEAVLRIAEEACRHSGVDKNATAELKNGLRNICEEIAIEVKSKKEKSIEAAQAAAQAAAEAEAARAATVPAPIDHNAPSSSDPALRTPIRSPGRSLPPTMRSSGQSQDSPQMSQMHAMLVAMGRELEKVQSSVGQLQHSRWIRRSYADDDYSD